MPSIDFKTSISTMAKPLVVAVAHVPIVLIALLASPLWIGLALKPAALERLAMRILIELRRWSAASITGTSRGSQ